MPEVRMAFLPLRARTIGLLFRSVARRMIPGICLLLAPGLAGGTAAAESTPSSPGLRSISEVYLGRWASSFLSAALEQRWRVRLQRLTAAKAPADPDTPALEECRYFLGALERRRRHLDFATAQEARQLTARLPTGAFTTLTEGVVLATAGTDGNGHAVVEIACLSSLDHQVITPRSVMLHHAAGITPLHLADETGNAQMLAPELALLSCSMLPDQGEAVGAIRADRVVVKAEPFLRTARFISNEVIPSTPGPARIEGIFTLVSWRDDAVAAVLDAGTMAAMTRLTTQRTTRRLEVGCLAVTARPSIWPAEPDHEGTCRVLPFAGVRVSFLSGRRFGGQVLFPVRLIEMNGGTTLEATFDLNAPAARIPALHLASAAMNRTGFTPPLTRLALGPLQRDVQVESTTDGSTAIGPALLDGLGYEFDPEHAELLLALPPVQISTPSPGGSEARSRNRGR